MAGDLYRKNATLWGDGSHEVRPEGHIFNATISQVEVFAERYT